MRGVSLWKVAGALLLAILLAPAAWAATYAVVNTQDSGPGSLRQAIADANANLATADTIVFNIATSDPGFDGSTFTIQPLSELPVLRATTIDGTTQTAFTGDTNPLGPEVVLDGSLLSAGSGLRLADDNVVRGLVIHGFINGLGVGGVYSWDSNPSNNRIEGNYLGTDATGTIAVPNSVGADFHGFGSPFSQATGNVIQDNLISGNQYDGISLCDADRTEIANNRIGTDRTGSAALGNGREGIGLYCAGSPRNRIAGNTIAWNGSNGILDAPDFRFGVSFTPNGHQGNQMTGNSIHSNGGLGIDVLPPPFPSGEPPFTPTANDACDGDTGGNLRQNFPEITRAERAGSATIVEGFLNSAPNQTFSVELFASAAADPSGAGEGETFLTALSVATDGSCLGSFSVTLPVAVPPGHAITATATDGAGNTSEFSWAEVVVGGNEPPVADAGEDQTVIADASCQAAVTLDGSGSSDPDGDALTFTWTGPLGTATGLSPVVTLEPGAHTIALTVDDGNGGTAADEVVVTVLDATPPTLSAVAASPNVLWPPNHKMRTVTVSASAADSCDTTPPACRLTAVTSNEPVNGSGDGETAPDWLITGSLMANLRAERSGKGTGRIYTLAVACSDAAGNLATGTALVTVPYSQGH
jgi:parallel beta-helix repeat protein